jgi:hypothetical protein
MDKNVLLTDIINYIQGTGINSQNWYVGIASDPETRVFNDHNVDRANGNWIYGPAQNSDSAREIEDYIITNYKTKGDTGGGDNSTNYVYAYRITASTRE